MFANPLGQETCKMCTCAPVAKPSAMKFAVAASSAATGQLGACHPAWSALPLQSFDAGVDDLLVLVVQANWPFQRARRLKDGERVAAGDP